MTSFTDTHPSMDACPPLEDIAAFLDGALPPEERERITAHLADCERCYEVFAGAAHFLEEESSAEDTRGVVHPFPLAGEKDRAPRRISRWLPLAASILLTAGVGFFAWQASRPPEITLADIVDTVEDQPAVADHLYEGERPRGIEEMPDTLGDGPSFMTGVYLIDLRLSVEAGRFESTDDLLQKLGTELTSVPLAEELAESYQEGRARLHPGMDVRQLKPELQKLEGKVQERLSDSSPSFSFGLWAEAGRLSALTQSPEFFERRNNRRFLSQLLKEGPPVPEGLHETVLDQLQVIESLWNKNDLSFEDLATHFQSIIKAIDEYEEDLLYPE